MIQVRRSCPKPLGSTRMQLEGATGADRGVDFAGAADDTFAACCLASRLNRSLMSCIACLVSTDCVC